MWLNSDLDQKFVTARLTEKFGRPDILSYLSTRPKNYTEWLNTWEKITKELWIPENPAELLAQMCEPMTGLGVGGDPIYYLVSSFIKREDTKVFSLYPDYLIVFPYFGKEHHCVLTVHGLTTGGRLSIGRLIRHLAHFEWDRNTKARVWLLANLEKSIHRVATQAKADFDQACAVTLDGTKITKADRVIVVMGDGRNLVFNGDQFQAIKIQRPVTTTRLPAYSEDEVWRAIRMVRNGVCHAVYCAAHNLKWNDDLVILESFVPTPLPASSGTMVREIA